MKHGFTLAELIITIVIFGVVLALIAPTLLTKNTPTTHNIKETIKYDYVFE